MQMIPPWAPNVHPMIHFPIVIPLRLWPTSSPRPRPRMRGLGAVATSLYLSSR